MTEFSVKLANEVTFKRMRETMERLRDTPINELSYLANILLGRMKPSAIQESIDLKFIDETLNDPQKDAVRFSLSSPEIALIHGPPGVQPLYYFTENRLARHTHSSK
jgi:DNA polymerase alpha-associated DNA helicase A